MFSPTMSRSCSPARGKKRRTDHRRLAAHYLLSFLFSLLLPSLNLLHHAIKVINLPQSFQQRPPVDGDRQLALEEKKFQLTTAELFTKFYKDQRAKEIMDRKGDHNVQVEDLVGLMFGEKPD